MPCRVTTHGSTCTMRHTCDHTRVHTRHAPYARVTSTHTSRVTARIGSDTNCNAPFPNMAKFYSARWVKHTLAPTPLTLSSSLCVKGLTRGLKCTWHLGLYIGETHSQLARWDNSPHSCHATHTWATSGLKFILVGPGCHGFVLVISIFCLWQIYFIFMMSICCLY